VSKYGYALVLLGGVAVLAFGARLVCGPQVRETRLGKLPAERFDGGLAVSPDGARVAVVESSGTGQTVVVDGVSWKKRYARILGVWFSPDSRRVGCLAEDGGEQFVVLDSTEGPRYDRVARKGPLFSPNSRHTAYEAERDGRRFMVVDGVEGPKYKCIGDFRFSLGGDRHAYVGRRNRHDYRVVLDGLEDSQAHPEPVGPLAFSPDGGRVAYAVAEVRGGTTVRRVVVHHQGGTKEYPGSAAGYGHVDGDSIRFSPDGSRLAFIAARGPDLAEEVMVLDGVEGKAHRHIARVYGFSPDGKHFAYVGDGKVIRDGVADKGRIGVWKMSFSPDGSRLVVAGVRNHRPVVVVDGVEVKETANRIDRHVAIRFSPGGAHLAFAGRQSVFLDGVEGKRYAEVLADSLCFSPDGGRVAYVAARRLGRYLVATDTGEGEEYDEILQGSLAFSPDGKHVAYVARRGAKWVLVVDGVETGGYDAFPAGAPYVFGGSDTVHAVALRDGELIRMEVRAVRRWPWEVLWTR
jgi:WD40 repeat protein